MAIKATHQFPQDFLWGCATAAHQVEGNNRNDWWRWEKTPGRIFQNQQAGLACDWWSGQRYIEDFDRAAAMHNNAQRFSLEWSRIEPEPGKWDEWALGRYREMILACRERGMEPMITLHHFSNPLWIDDQKSWLWDETPRYFERYVRKVVSVLGDLCTLWCTINEPMVYATQGFFFGTWPPGLRGQRYLGHVTKNLLIGHAAAYHAIKEIQPQSQVGLASHHITIRPLRPILWHQLAASGIDNFFNRMFIHALRDGVARSIGMPRIHVPQVKGTLDWIGLQYYQLYDVSFNLLHPSSIFMEQKKPTDMPVGPGSWGGLAPREIFRHIQWLWKTLGKPIYITETGVPDPDDSKRPGYLVETVHSVWQAINNNFPVRGFFFWSLLDNFEWAEGFDPRFSFGLYKTNFATQERVARRSASLYGEICQLNGLSNEIVERYTPELLASIYPGAAGQNEIRLKSPARAL